MRVVSLLPSATETLVAIGGSHLLVGRSTDCDASAVIGNLPCVTRPAARAPNPRDADQRTRDLLSAGLPVETLDADLLRSVRPDLILVQDRCAVCSTDGGSVRRLAETLAPKPRVLSVDVDSIEGMLDAAITIGEAVGLESDAEQRVTAWRERLHTALDNVTPYTAGPRVAVLEWTDPLFVGGGWVPQLVERAGASHPLLETQALTGAGAGAGAHGAHRVAPPSRQITQEDLIRAELDTVVVAPCGEPLERAVEAAQTLREQSWWGEVGVGRVCAVSGALLSRPGPRLVDAQEWFVGWVNDRPGLIPEGFPWEAL